MRNSGRREKPVLAVLATDLLLASLFLLLFAFFHHVLPFLEARLGTAGMQTTAEVPASFSSGTEDSIEAFALSPATTATEAVFPPAADDNSLPVEVSPLPTPEPTPDNRTPWQIRFEEYFTDEPVITENSYSSPNVSIRIDTVSTEVEEQKVTYHVADIHLASIGCFRTYVAHGSYNYFDTQDISEMDTAVDSLLSISGDFCTYQQTGFLVRNGEICRNDEAWCDICVVYEDGTMECRRHYDYTNEEVMSRGALQVWNFGPSLFDADGHARNDFYLDVSQTVMYPNPRSAIGYYEPGHYCFVVVDGRQEGYSDGMLLNDLAALFEELGCKCAYNLDGGGSAVMTFLQQRYSRQSNGADRALGDILYICEPEEK